MSFRPRTDANPNIIIQNVQSKHLDTQASLLPNTIKDGSGTYYSPLLSSDGHLIVNTNGSDSNIVHGTTNATLINNTSYITGTHLSTFANCTNSTGLMTLHGSITGDVIGQIITVQGGITFGGTYYDLNDIHINLVHDGTLLTFASNFETAFPFIRIKYKNGDIVTRTVNAILIYKT